MPAQPYMYDPPQRYSATADTLYGFDPRAATKASRVPPRSPPKQQDGPLVDFNRHPDNYLVLPQGRGTAKPMNPKVKVAIKSTRWVQLGLRILQLIGAIGLLICVICIKGTQITEGWIIRVPAAVDIVCELYAIYHLVRPAKSRAPSSSASYHFFALVIDTGLIPFYVFTALLANSNWQEAPGTDGRWRTFFKTDDATYKVLLSTWLASVTVGGLHLISIGLGLYLVLVFRKIAKMPPDMNPLEDNLTSRGNSMRRHKYKTSSLSDIPPPPEKRWSEMSGSTAVSSPSRSSHAQDEQPLIPDVRKMPFMHSRRGSNATYNPHNPRSARESRVFEAYSQQPQSNRASRVGGGGASSISPPKLDLTNLPVKISPGSAGGYDSMSPTSSPGGRSPARSKRESLKNDNWFVHPEAEHDSGSDYGDDDEPTAQAPLVKQRRYSFEAGQDDEGAVAAMYQEIVTAHQPHGPLSPLSDGENTGHLRPEPLRMNPPSPQPPAPLNPTPPKKSNNNNANTSTRPAPPPPMPSFMSEIGSVSSDRSATTIGRALTINSTVTRNTDNWSYFPSVQHARHTYNGGTINDSAHTNFLSPPSRTPTGSTGRKARYYGDLKDAQDSILGARNSNRNNNNNNNNNNKKGRASPPPPLQQQKPLPKMYPQLSPGPARSPGISPALGLLPPNAGGGTTHRAMGRSPQRPAYARMETSPRVVSRSGVDVELVGGEDEEGDLGVPSLSKGRRVVSGRAAEEGLAGFGVVRRKVSGMA